MYYEYEQLEAITVVFSAFFIITKQVELLTFLTSLPNL